MTLSPVGGGTYVPGAYDQAGTGSTWHGWVGQGQEAWFSYDITSLAGQQVCGLTFSFTQANTTNHQYFPITIQMYDVSTQFDRLIIDRIPIDAEGEAIALDLHTGRVYQSFQAAAAEGSTYQVALNEAAIADFGTAIRRGRQYFSVSMAGAPFTDFGYFTALNGTLSAAVDCNPKFTIDIQPGDPANIVRLTSARLNVAAISTSIFDATQVDPRTCTLRGAKDGIKPLPTTHAIDVDQDGDLDLVMSFSIPKLMATGNLDSSTTSMRLTCGALTDIDVVAPT